MPDDLNVRITGDPSGGVSAAQAFTEAINQMASQVVSKLDEINKSVQGTGEQVRHLREPVSDLQEGVDAFGKKFSEAFSVKSILSEFASGLVSVAGPIALVEMALEGVKEVLGEIFAFTKEGILKADAVRDLSLSLNVYTGSIQAGTQAMLFFQQQQERTRNTAEQLGEALRKIEPLATARGISNQMQESMIVQMSQLATIKGSDLDQMMSGFQRVLATGGAGGGAGRNPFLSALGIDKDQLKNLDFSGVMALIQSKMGEVTSHFDEFGQTIQSQMVKIKESILVNFAEGFNESRGTVTGGMGAIRDLFNDPAVLQGVRDLGSGVASLFGYLKDGTDIVRGIAASFHDLASDQGSIALLGVGMRAIVTALQDSQPIILALKGAVDYAKVRGEQSAAESSLEATQQMNANRQRQMYSLAQQQLEQSGLAYNPNAFNFNISSQLGQWMIGQHDPAQTKKLMDDLIEDAKYGTVSFQQFQAAVQDALGVMPSYKFEPAEDKLVGLKDHVKALTDAWRDQIDVIAAHEAALGITDAREKAIAAYYLLNAENVLKETKATNDLAEARQKLGTGSQLVINAEKALADLTSADRGNEMQKLLVGYSQAFQSWMTKATGAGGRLDIAPESSAAWQAFDQEIANALTDATEKVNNFSERAQEKLAAWAPNAAANVRLGLAQIKSDVADAFEWIKLQQISLTLMTGIQPNDPQMAALNKKLIGDVSTQAGISEAQVIKVGERLNSDAEKSAQKIASIFDITFHGAESLFSDFFTNGGRNFGKLAAQEFASIASSLFSQNLNSFLENRAGVTQASNGLYYFQGGTQGYQTPEAAMKASPTGQNFAIGSAAIGDLLSGYQAGASGQANAATTAAINGAIGGAMLGFAKGAATGGVYGAVIGAAIGFLGAYLGKSETNPNVGGIPQVDASGHGAVLATPGSGFSQQQIDTWNREITATFDTVRDSITKAFIAGGATPPSIGTFTNLSPLTAPDKNLAATDIDQWIKGGMGAQMMAKVGGDFTKIAESLGMSSKKFGEIWDTISRIDPQQGAQDLATLFTALTTFRDFSKFLGGDRSIATLLNTSGSTTYQTELQTLSQATPFDDIRDFAKQMVDVANNIHNFSPEGQIQQVSQLAQMVTTFRQQEIALVQQLQQAIVSAKQSADQMLYGIGVQRFTRDDGTVDQQGLAQFYQKRANDDLRNMGNATSAAQLQQLYQDYLQAVGNTGNAMIALNPANRQNALDWETTATNQGLDIFNARATALGVQIDKINTDLSNDLGPAFKDLLGSTDDLNTGVGKVGGGFKDLLPPVKDIGNKLLELGPTISATNDAMGQLAKSAAAAAAALDANNGDAAQVLVNAAGILVDAAHLFAAGASTAAAVSRVRASRSGA